MPSPLLAVSNIAWQINNKAVLSDISFTINGGDVTGIIGPNGAGKTSLLRCIYQRLKPSKGSIEFLGNPIEHYTQQSLAQHIAVVSQQSQVLYPLSVFDVVKMGLLPNKGLFERITKADKKNIERALCRVGLTGQVNHMFDTLSGGEQQRVFIARALVQGAQLLILDEPTNHLDVYYQHQILHLIRHLGLTIIMTVHDLNLAAKYCQRLILLNQGKIVKQGSVHQVLQPDILQQTFRLPCQVVHNDQSAPQIAFNSEHLIP